MNWNIITKKEALALFIKGLLWGAGAGLIVAMISTVILNVLDRM